MSFNKNILHRAVIAAIVTSSLGFVACSSGSGGSASGADVTRIGRITGFGSVFVGGVEYDTSNASISKDGQSAVNGDDDLKVGMIVTVKGTANGNQGVATSIEFTDELEGVVQENTLLNADGTANPNGSLTVMGQTVTVDANTNFESDDPAITVPEDIPAGAILEVSGYNDGAGNILASFIELKAKDMASYNDDMEVKGIVANLNETATSLTFDLGKVTVDASDLIGSIDLGQPLADGLYVEVKSKTGFDTSGNLIASKIELEEDGDYEHDGDEGEEMEVEGMVTAIAGDGSSIDIDGRPVLIPEGMDISGFATGDMVEVEFTINADGQAVADEIEKEDHEDKDDFSVEDYVDSIDAANSTITVAGKVIHVDKFNAIMVDHGDAPVKYFDLADLAVGDFVEVEYYVNDQGDNVAIKLERESDPRT